MPAAIPYHETYEHDADIGVRGVGGSLAVAFAEAALALMSLVTDPRSVRALDAVGIACEAPDDELLFVDWLNALIYEMATRRMLFGRFEVAIDDHRLVATVWGEAVDVNRHQPAVEIKGATYTTLRVERERNSSWIAQTVVDV